MDEQMKGWHGLIAAARAAPVDLLRVELPNVGDRVVSCGEGRYALDVTIDCEIPGAVALALFLYDGPEKAAFLSAHTFAPGSRPHLGARVEVPAESRMLLVLAQTEGGEVFMRVRPTRVIPPEHAPLVERGEPTGAAALH